MQIPVVRNVLEANEKLAQVVRERVRGILTLNLISSPGAGKTTLACLAAGLLEPSAGSVRLGGAPLATGDVCIAFQQPAAEVHIGRSWPPAEHAC